MRRILISIVGLLLVSTPTSVPALELTQINPSGDSIVVDEGVFGASAQWITQSDDPCTIVDGTSVACAGSIMVDTGWWRLFDLDGDHGMSGSFCATAIDYAIQQAVGESQDTTARVYCLDDGEPFTMNALDLIWENSVPQPEVHLEPYTMEVPPGVCCDSDTQSMAVEMASDDCTDTGTCIFNFVGHNDLGESSPTYISSPDCGIIDPVDLDLLGFPSSHLILVVHGEDDGGTGGGSGDPCGGGVPDVPATTGPGLALLVAALLAGGALRLHGRRRS
jgi:hypothetical protein